MALEMAPGIVDLMDADGRLTIARLEDPHRDRATWIGFTPDGTRLITSCIYARAVHVWDLRLIRQRLKDMDLDWDWPEFPPDTEARPAAAPNKITVVPGSLRKVPFPDDRLNVSAISMALWAAPKSPELYLQRGLAHGRLKEPRKAIADYTKFLELAPPRHERYGEVLIRRASNYNILRDFAPVFADMQKLLNLGLVDLGWNQQIASLCNNGAWHYAATPPKEGLPKDVLAIAQKAAELEPSSVLYQNTLGVVYYRLERYQDAVDCLEKNLIPNKDFAAFDLYFIAMSYAKLGQPAKARDYYNRANDWVKERAGLASGHLQELKAFRAEAEALLGMPVEQIRNR